MGTRGKRPPSLAETLGADNATLSRLRQHADHLLKAETAIARALPVDLAEHWKVAAVDNRRVRLVAFSAAWATRLRFESENVRRALADAGYGSITSVDVRIGSPPPEPRPTTRRELPETARRQLESAARGIDAPELAAALRRLARRRPSD